MKQILIVEDDVVLLDTLKIFLEDYKKEFNVLTAQNGGQAIEILEHESIDLLVTDLRMPGVDGLELFSYTSNAYPFLPSIIMTASATPEVEEWAEDIGVAGLVRKPIDYNHLVDIIKVALDQETGQGTSQDVVLADFLQTISMEKKTCLLHVSDTYIDGHIYVVEGDMVSAALGSNKGEDAFYWLLAPERVNITFLKLPKKKITNIIKKPLMSLLMAAREHLDEMKASSPPSPDVNMGSEMPIALLSPDFSATENVSLGSFTQKLITGVANMGKLEDSLSKIGEVAGFLAAGVFTPNGEMAAELNSSTINLAEVGSLANDILMKAQQATTVMNVGRGQVVHIETPEAHIIARCYNENEDYSKTVSGKAHAHLILLLNKDANLTMGKIKLESICHEVAEAFR